jgi:hypothetical protein
VQVDPETDGEPAPDGETAPESPDIRAGWRLAIGVGGIVASAFTFVLLPVVATVVAGWWLVADMRGAGARAPGWLGKVALAVLAALWLAISWLVVGFDAHFDCGGTLGGFGESASARLDDDCYERRVLRVPIVGACTVGWTILIVVLVVT